MHRRTCVLAACTGLLLCIALASELHAQGGISCNPPELAFKDADGNWFCAASEPNMSCYEDIPPYYDAEIGRASCRERVYVLV